MRAQELEVVWETTLYTERGSRHAHVRPRHHFARILQTKTEPAPSHSGSGRHNCAVSVARIYLTWWFARPSRLSHTGGGRRRDPLCCDLGGPPLLVPTEARQATYADTAGTGPMSRELRKNLFLVTRSAQSRNRPSRERPHDPYSTAGTVDKQ